ncbi:hypothetical protein KKH39_04970 [Patescibacteria group bacterium]|nr:hypothetical protein [Patescibacteria group bacterium]
MSKQAGATIDGRRWVPFPNNFSSVELVEEQSYDGRDYVSTGRLRRAGQPWPIWDTRTRLVYLDPHGEGRHYQIIGDELIRAHPVRRLIKKIVMACASSR